MGASGESGIASDDFDEVPEVVTEYVSEEVVYEKLCSHLHPDTERTPASGNDPKGKN